MNEAGSLVTGRNAVLEALRIGIPARSLLMAEGLRRDPRLQEITQRCTQAGVAIRQVERDELDRRAGHGHQGVVLLIAPFRYADAGRIVADARTKFPRLFVVTDGVTDPHNFGAIVRSAAAFGAAGVVTRTHRAVGVTPAVWKASAGTVALLPVAQVVNIARFLQELEDFVVVGLAGDAELDLAHVAGDAATDPVALVVGAEGSGLSRLVREKCTVTARIPMRGGVESLNAAVAVGIALYVLGRR
ncbi:MAG: 23S rRNA (guanosine(2251)-2'-O)-methyltransferase RlmB [Acidothermus sp.]|nr:23S rRNA (guanosine(2251)-2'-O)-methyltransferase RlmB [Acidothermus sp.]MCL6538273.1 23S rRNA (guanosine(2251)-2'-O)-methyltransferase RlmB [Acidothermus sp.]